MAECALRLAGVSKSFHRRALLRDIDIEIPMGSSVALVGPNGSGKSVLMRIMCRLLQPDAGHVTLHPSLFDNPRDSLPANVGVLIDSPGFIAGRSGLDNLRTLARIRRRVDEATIADLMTSYRLDPGDPTRVARYSTGMRQKIGIIQAVMEDQQLLILDEPFNGLDEESAALVHENLQEYHSQGRTIIFSSHHRIDVGALADQVLRLSDGTITADS